MHLVIGGAYQGKKEYVKKKYSIEESDIWQGGYPVAEGDWRCIDGLHKIIKQMLHQYEADCICEVKADEKVPKGSVVNSAQQIENYVNQISDYLRTLTERSPDLIFICDEVGNGIVPMEKAERNYRECVGRALCALAGEADRVERVCCGIPQLIKNTVYISLIRHGSTEGNLKKQYIGATDEPLCREGRESLAAWKKENRYPAAARVIVSPMQRCLETAKVLYPDVTPEIYPEFRETDFGLFEGKSYEELMQDDTLKSVYQEWIDSDGRMPFPGGESMEQMQGRYAEGFERFLSTLREDTVMIVHGGTIMSLLQMYAAPQKDYYDYQCANGAGYLCRVERTGDQRLYQMKVVRAIPGEQQAR